ncbi:PREDICTED: phosphorylated adapter RNA export protein [Galeopterus variegatus]|uniref:Phosphorylated adapter RNA export protein n=1 Tax=Galeopterus variegatus TaxID=482537 RepID=A0ABM0SI72_GALVR|nr:PREDICTED: phosphorylated adapter RNA export protein [Galeopterus variegatus]
MALEAGDMEDGQLSDSDSDMTVAPSDRTDCVFFHLQKVLGGDSAVRAFQSTTTACAPVSHYRTVKSLDSSEESFSDSDDDSSLWKRKRQKCFNPPPKPEPFQVGQSCQKAPVAGGKKVNNIWGAVLQEQNQDAVATELGILGMEGTIDKSRQSETYNYLLAKKLKKESQEYTKELDKELGEYMHDVKKTESKEDENGQGNLKRKRPVRDRIGMNYKGRYEITEEDSQEKVADEISFRLQEPKKDLIARVVRIIGNKKAIELLMETAEVEQNGGLFVMNGSRRRTPGGVFLNLLKNTPSISEEQIKDIFYIENQKEYENKKAARKRRTQVLGKKMKQAIKSLNFQEDDDTSRETFASDTNEALASLDEPQEGHGEAKLDAEEAIEVDHSHDLDIF